MKFLLNTILPILVAFVLWVIGSFISNVNPLMAQDLELMTALYTCVADWSDDYVPGYCGMQSTIDSCSAASSQNTMHVFHNRKCVFTFGGKCQDYSYTEKDVPDPTMVVTYDEYQANCVWSASGCTVDHIENVIPWNYIGSGTAKSGHNCKGTQGTNNPYKEPKFCPTCP